LADRIVSVLELDAEQRQQLLETLDPSERLRRVLVWVQRQIAVLEAQRKIHDKVQQELGDRQREIVLREQLKAIQNELSEGDADDDLSSLRRRIEALDLPAPARREAERELQRLARQRDGAEGQVARTFLETLVELPWNERSADDFDLQRAQQLLEEDHYGLPEVKDRVLEFLAVCKLRTERANAKSAACADKPGSDPVDVPTAEVLAAEALADGAAARTSDGDERKDRGATPILLFAGPPGVGKTSVARAIARALGKAYVRISLGGVRDEADIRGHRRTYVGALPGRLIAGLREAGTRNPVILLDEVDKLGRGIQGDPAAALLEVLDPAQNHRFVDHYLGVPFDLSEVMFIATANVVEAVPPPLRDRMELIDFRGYTEHEKLEIAVRHLLPRLRSAHALEPAEFMIDEAALLEIVRSYTYEAGVRGLERELKKIARKLARRVAVGEPVRQIAVDRVAELLGRQRVRPERQFAIPQVGIAAGMYYTPAGGDVLFVEVSTMPGHGELTLTGQLGDVMRESARTAWSWARAHGERLGLTANAFARDVHIHVPAGAVPKDGPSAGIAIATALVSALGGAAVRHDVAMTGELTLSGRVLPVGGIKEKLLGAHRAGMRKIVMPLENIPDLDELPEQARRELDITAVERLDQVLDIALLPLLRPRYGLLGWTPPRLLDTSAS
jgi:ATP-dependent Lon protease